MPRDRRSQATPAQIALLHTMERERLLLHVATRCTELVTAEGLRRSPRSPIRLQHKTAAALQHLELLEKVPVPPGSRISYGTYWKVSNKGRALLAESLRGEAACG